MLAAVADEAVAALHAYRILLVVQVRRGGIEPVCATAVENQKQLESMISFML